MPIYVHTRPSELSDLRWLWAYGVGTCTRSAVPELEGYQQGRYTQSALECANALSIVQTVSLYGQSVFLSSDLCVNVIYPFQKSTGYQASFDTAVGV